MIDSHDPDTGEPWDPEIVFEGEMFARVRETAESMSIAHMRFVEHCAELTVLLTKEITTERATEATGITCKIRLALEEVEYAIDNHRHAVRDEQLFQFRQASSGTLS